MNIRKKKLALWLRKLHLLQIADWVMCLRSFFQNKSSNRLFLQNHPAFIPPPLALAYDAYNHVSWPEYYEVGQRHAELVTDLLREFLPSEDALHICEWGCGPARVIQHINKMEGFEQAALVGTDYNKASIDWCSEHISGVKFLVNNLTPPLPVEAAYFDCIFALSIFTHLSKKMHVAWIEDLFLRLKPGGALIFTTHGDLCAKNRLLPVDKAQYDEGHLVIRGGVQEGKKHFSAYHPVEFIRDDLLKGRRVLKHIASPASYRMEQDVWIVQKV